MPSPPFEYDAFLSYSTDPDYHLARDLESFLETFHELPRTADMGVRPLRVCRDGSDFRVPRNARSASEIASASEIITRHLERSEYLVVICSQNAALSPWVLFECNWFLEHRGASRILLCVSEGADPKVDDASLFPEPLKAAGLPGQIWFDLRGLNGRRAKKWEKVREYDDERVRIAAELLGVAAGEIRPVWLRERERLARRDTVRRRSVLGGLTFLALTAVFFFARSRIAQDHDLRSQSRSEFLAGTDAVSRGDIPLALRHVLSAIDIHPTATAANWRLTTLLSQRLFPVRRDFGITQDAGVVGVRFDPDGKRLATVARDGQVKVWSLNSGSHANLPRRPGDTIRTIVFAPRDGILLTGSARGVVDLWDTNRRMARTDSFRLGSGVERVAFTGQGDRAAAVGADGKVHMLGVAGGRVSLRYARTFPTPITDVALSLAGQYMAVATPSGVFVLELASGRTLHTLDVPDEWTQVSSRFTPNGSRLIVAGGSLLEFVLPGVAPGYDGGGFQVWDVRSGAPVSRFVRSVAGLKDLDVSADGSRAATVAINGEVSLLDLDKGVLIPTRGHPEAVEDVEFSPDGSAIVTASFDGKARLWDSETGVELAEPMVHRAGVAEAHFRPDGAAVATVTGDGEVVLWELPVRVPLFAYSGRRPIGGSGGTNTVAPSAPLPAGNATVRALARRLGTDINRASVHGTVAAFALANGRVELWDMGTERHRRTITMPSGYRGAVGLVRFSPTGNLLLTAQQDAELTARIWDRHTGREYGKGITNTGEVTSVAFSPDERLVAVGTASGGFRVWNARTGVPAFEPKVHPGEYNLIKALAFNHDGSILATYGLNSNDLLLWDTQTGKPVSDPFRLNSVGGDVRLSFDGDSRVSLASGDVAHPYTLNLCGASGQSVRRLTDLARELSSPGTKRPIPSRPKRRRNGNSTLGECINWLTDTEIDPSIQPGVSLRLSTWIRELVESPESSRGAIAWLRTETPFNPIAKAALVYAYAATDHRKAEAYAAPLLHAGVSHPAVAYFLAKQSIVSGNLNRADSLLSLPVLHRSQEYPLDSLRSDVRQRRAIEAQRPSVEEGPPSTANRLSAGVREPYSVQVHRGWRVDRPLAGAVGMQLLMYTRGFTYEAAPAVVYSNSRQLDAQIRNAEDFVQNTIRSFAAQGHTVTVRERDSVRTADGRTARIAIYDADPSYPNYEAGAYVAGQSELIYFVYTTKSAALFQRHLPEFMRIIRSLRVGAA